MPSILMSVIYDAGIIVTYSKTFRLSFHRDNQ